MNGETALDNTRKNGFPGRLKVPRHLGVILDGNRRFAKALNLDPWKGHEYGEKKVGKLLEWCNEYGIEELTLYTFSMQNFNRPKKEFDYIMDLFRKGSEKLLKDKRLYKYDIKVRFIGRTHLFPVKVQELMRKLEEATKDNKKHRLNFAMAYGGREEIIDGVKKLASKIADGSLLPESISEKTISEYLYIDSEPDLIIRTGGEKRTSNFLLWQSSYSEWIFLDKTWPEFEKEDFISCIEEYSSRDRRMGR